MDQPIPTHLFTIAVNTADEFAATFGRLAAAPGFEDEKPGLLLAQEVAAGYSRRMAEESYGQLPAGGAA